MSPIRTVPGAAPLALGQQPTPQMFGPGGQRTDRRPWRVLAALGRSALEHELAHHRHEAVVDPGGGGTDRLDAEPLGRGEGLGVEVVDDLHVVGDEADRHQHDLADAVGRELLEVVVDVRFEPRRRGGT